ncbi:MAG: hypothetical protein IKB79_04000 [Oscillospiraceae bacterium]|nr:hypothetical protein [Oscillospiraceae bacterium]
MNNETLLIAPAPTPDEVAGVIGGADAPTTIMTAEVGVAENLGGAVQILGQGMASIFVVLGIIALFVGVLKKLDNKKKK